VAFREARTVGVVIERRRLAHAWAGEAWAAVAVLPEPLGDEWRLLREADGRTQVYAGSLPLELFRNETASYKYNLETGGKVYVALRPSGEAERPFVPSLATVAPDEGQAAMEGGETIVDAVPMPPEIRGWVAAFVDAHHVEEPFYKRQRKRHEAERPR
jgi:hypothetical protein